ncbi:CPBP family intramembrane glutamic endopeptidase [Clostridium tagluense]|uniref:CPBP family intramembrane glutamic endopeptidase n=1 Tax=Clostridium tagluense TaxID=360422 RepID=UPI001C6F26E0|nr:CPBP family intramembrane glutamic endopeptidase [Clostridium tagluense]MBW9155827.1 CPBP family intramembrane metalloprotease [Clostridium tagluense]WLC63882.1 CPBP family intramembrane metalloprotease [Clostridium tagluense]
MKKKYIILSSLVACILLYFVEQVLVVSYVVKTIIKILFFIFIPYAYSKFIKKQKRSKAINYKNIDKDHLKMGFLFGIMSFFIVLITYYLLRNIIDLHSISEKLQINSKITASSFIYVGLYITFGNSFLEEYFFRGFIFLNLYELKSKKFAYIYSSLLFGLYHIAIFKTLFNSGLVGLALIGLISIGFIFNWLDTKSKNFINSWIVHILADSAIIIIGLRMFGIV